MLESYFPIADSIAETFGSSCEVVVHDLTKPAASVVHVANGTVTGRALGQSFDHLVKQVLLNKNFKDDRLSNYFFQSEDGRTIKSSSVLIRDTENEVIGMLCINFDVTSTQAVHKYLSDLLGDAAASGSSIEEEPDQDVMAIIDNLIGKIVGDIDATKLSRKQCVEIVSFMDEKGIFLVRGALEKVANLMGVSKVTIYSYLDEAKGKR